jgi:GNAT superfamily N-acetyltransferase
MSEVSYREMKDGEEHEVSNLVQSQFQKYIAHTYKPQGLEEFLAFTTPDRLLERKRAGQLILVAEHAGSIVGVITIRDANHISLMFVHDTFHRQGIGTELVRRAAKEMKMADPGVCKITVNASPYAVPFYEQLGFIATGPQRFKRGMLITPMVLDLGIM